MGNKDRLYAIPQKAQHDFSFNQQVADVFPDMINRSIPGYQTIIDMTGILAQHYAQANTVCYDLGCALGASSLAMQQHITDSSIRIVAVDNAPAMLAQFRKTIAASTQRPTIEIIEQDINDLSLNQASMVTLNFTLQFLPLKQRSRILMDIYKSLVPGGILLLSEKIRSDDSDTQTLYTDLHHDYKISQGYSNLEVAQKRTALENVLIPETWECHLQRLKHIGFSEIHRWFDCLNFTSCIAIKR